MLKNRFFQIQKNNKFKFLGDFLINQKFPEKKIKNYLQKKLIFINEKVAYWNSVLATGKRIHFFLNEKEKKAHNNPRSIQIIHCDDDFLIVNKPYGMTVHADPNHKENNVIFFLKKWLNFSQDELKKFLPVVHRLDKSTTGIFLLARNLTAAKKFRHLIKIRKIKRKYLAIATGVFSKSKIIIDVPLIKPGRKKRSQVSFAGKNAKTHIKVLIQKNKFALIECELETGRTHQIRSHLKFIHHEILNDSLYGNTKSPFLFLHSYKMEFILKDKKESQKFEIPPPLYFFEQLKKI